MSQFSSRRNLGNIPLVPRSMKNNFDHTDNTSMVSNEIQVSYDDNSNLARHEMEHSSTSEGDEHAPEALVRKDNKVVRANRALVVGILLTATVLTSFFVYRFVARSQETSFEDAFESVASKLANALISDVSLKFWMAQTLSEATTMLLRVTNSTATNLIFDQVEFQSNSRLARFYGNVNVASWNPLLRSDDERRQFEEFAQTQTLIVGTDPVCFVCGSADRGFTNPESLIEVPGFGYYSCGLLELSGRQGLVPEEVCPLYIAASSSTCHCVDLAEGADIASNTIEIPETLIRVDEESGEAVQEPYLNPPYLATWTSSGLGIVKVPVMVNQMSNSYWKRAIDIMLETELPVLSETFARSGAYYEKYAGSLEGGNDASLVLQFPVFLSDSIAGSISFDISWSTFVSSVFPPLSQFVDIVVENTCGQNFTYSVDTEANHLSLQGEGDLHDPKFTYSAVSSSYTDYENIISVVSTRAPREGTQLSYCRYRFHVFATEAFEDEYLDSDPFIFAIITASIFVFTSIIFFLYDRSVARRQSKLMNSANRTNAIVSSLFPKNVRDRLFEQAQSGDSPSTTLRVSKLRMHSFLHGENKDSLISSEPIADLFASATVMFLDIADFTAWSSEREPTQVFQLLENCYRAFDTVAKSLSVFKVETIGDSYVAVCGLPTRREGHAPIMVQFADRCLKEMTNVTRRLEVILGPSTGDLEARVGLHSGPVTAGVLRGEKARFQLFGDTVNTASRMEDCGKPGHIHASQATVDLLVEAGKGHWAQKRKEEVTIKGKGRLQTYWLKIRSETPIHSSQVLRDSNSGLENPRVVNPSVQRSRKNSADVLNRLVDWNVEVVYVQLLRLIAHRRIRSPSESSPKVLSCSQLEEAILNNQGQGRIVIDEMTEVLSISEFHAGVHLTNPIQSLNVDPKVKGQLRDYIYRIACQYRDVPFHNFEHVSHVVMSASKLMNRIVNPDDIDYRQNSKQVARAIHDVTFGVSSDPILQFAVVFSALIHDVDHTGLTNAELIAMETPDSIRYRNQSVAEQNSVDLAWTMLMESKYAELRGCIYSNEDELRHFRQTVVNAVMATDIADKQLKQYRESRWDMAFPSDTNGSGDASQSLVSEQVDANRKATIVFEYIIQASDVAHTMQHWYTYQKFNRRLFEERYQAWLNGHAEKDPSLGWYGGELWFFDNYIIPLAKKLDKCGVFGVSYDEYLTYAIENRKEWQLKGKDIVEEMKAGCESKYAKELATRIESREKAVDDGF